MFAIHQNSIQNYAKQNADNLFQVTQFVLLTIQQPLFNVPTMMQDVNQHGGNSVYLWGVKRTAWEWHNEHRQEVFDKLMMIDHCHVNPEHLANEALLYLASLSGLGLVKAGFVAQLVLGVAGCLDTHNVAQYGLKQSAFNASRFKQAKTAKTRQALVSNYLALCARLGGAAGLWDKWCNYVHDKTIANGFTRYNSGFDVSAMHCTALGLVA